MEMVLTSSAFRVFVFNALSQRMVHLLALVEDVAFRGVAPRLAVCLLQHPRPIETTHQKLADELGTRREVVSRILEAFQHAGLIRLSRKRIEILDARALDGLHRVAEG
jgi:CRP/FNR family transcriptional regulator